MLSKIIQFVNPVRGKISNEVNKYQKELMLFAAIILISLFSFAIGYIMANYQKKEPIHFESNINQ